MTLASTHLTFEHGVGSKPLISGSVSMASIIADMGISTFSIAASCENITFQEFVLTPAT